MGYVTLPETNLYKNLRMSSLFRTFKKHEKFFDN